jgi:hypothetical protein
VPLARSHHGEVTRAENLRLRGPLIPDPTFSLSILLRGVRRRVMMSRLFLLICTASAASVLAQLGLVDEIQQQQIVLNLQEPKKISRSPIGHLRRFDLKDSDVLKHVLELAEVLKQLCLAWLPYAYLNCDRKMIWTCGRLHRRMSIYTHLLLLLSFQYLY